MTITDGIETGRDYYWKRSNGWNWWLVGSHPSSQQRERRWWTYYVEFTGLNGAGGAWVKVKSQWNGAPVGLHFTQPQSLSWEETQAMLREIKLNLVGIPGIPEAGGGSYARRRNHDRL